MTYSFILPLRQYRSSPRVKYLALHIQPSSYYNMRQSPSGELSRGVFRVPACPYRQRTPGDFPMERAGVGGSSTIQEPPVQSRGNTVSGLVKVLSSLLALNSAKSCLCFPLQAATAIFLTLWSTGSRALIEESGHKGHAFCCELEGYTIFDATQNFSWSKRFKS